MFAEYSLASLAYVHPSPSRSFLSPVRIVSFLCLTSVALLHGLHIPSGIRLQNALGFLKFGILSIVLVAGLIALCGHLQEGVQRPGNFDSWETIWEGSRTDGSVISASLYNVRPANFTSLCSHRLTLFPGHLFVYWIQQRQLRIIGNEGSGRYPAHRRPACHLHYRSVLCVVQHRIFCRGEQGGDLGVRAPCRSAFVPQCLGGEDRENAQRLCSAFCPGHRREHSMSITVHT